MLYISHSIYLLPEERNLLSKVRTSIHTVGFSVPSNTKDLKTPLTEVFVKYIISTESTKRYPQIELIPEGYKITLDDLDDFTQVKEEENPSLFMTMKNAITKDGVVYPVRHQISIKDVSALERTTVCEQLARFLKSAPQPQKK
jgi:hypothetical protein